jgi:2-polyprenyl-3-methyl-5-hydroxy-6-metoxy-1,4-benzoquinol methylase
MNQQEAFKEGTDHQFEAKPLTLGPWTSFSFYRDAKHRCFVLSRYKFVAKMLEGKQHVLEIGCGDGFGFPLVAQSVGWLTGTDVDDRLIDGDRERYDWIANGEFINHNIVGGRLFYAIGDNYIERFDAAYSIDVIEHLDPEIEPAFMENIAGSLSSNGVYIMGTPNKYAEEYASPESKLQHINLHTPETLKSLMDRYFVNTFSFGQNDEVVHTGFGKMRNYLWCMGVGVK